MERIGGYVLDRVLGEGGMGVVYLATHPRSGQRVALKILKGVDEVARRRFVREFRLTSRIEHPNVVRVIDLEEDLGFLYLVMDWVDGPTLEERVGREGPFDEDVAVSLALEVARALAAAHGCGIVHRDVKPSNVLLDRRGRVLLADLGIARLLDEAGPGDSITRTGAAFGSPPYMSPEQFEDARSVGFRTDLYSLGATLHFALTGRAPFEARRLSEWARLHGSAPRPDPRDSIPSISRETVEVLRALLAIDPASRPASTELACGALEDLLSRIVRGHVERDGPAPRRPVPAALETPTLAESPAGAVAAQLPERHRAEAPSPRAGPTGPVRATLPSWFGIPLALAMIAGALVPPIREPGRGDRELAAIEFACRATMIALGAGSLAVQRRPGRTERARAALIAGTLGIPAGALLALVILGPHPRDWRIGLRAANQALEQWMLVCPTLSAAGGILAVAWAYRDRRTSEAGRSILVPCALVLLAVALPRFVFIAMAGSWVRLLVPLLMLGLGSLALLTPWSDDRATKLVTLFGALLLFLCAPIAWFTDLAASRIAAGSLTLLCGGASLVLYSPVFLAAFGLSEFLGDRGPALDSGRRRGD